MAGTAIEIIGSGTLAMTMNTYTPGKAVISGGSLTLGGHIFAAVDSLRVSGSGVVVMTNPADSLIVGNGVTVWGGGDETGKLTNGALVLGGSFTQPGAQSASSFATSGNFSTAFYAATPITITMTYAGGNASRFQNLDLSGAVGGVTLATDVPVLGTLADTIGPSFPTTIAGNGHMISAGGVQIDGLTLDSALVKITGSAGQMFDSVTFQHESPTAAQLTVQSSGTYTFNGLTFSTTPTTGYYLSADNIGANLDITITSNLGSAGSAFTQLLNGATATWN